MFKIRKLRCSFCRKDESQVAKLVAGPRVYICDECVSVASALMSDNTTSSLANEAKLSTWSRLLDSVRRLWKGHARVIGSMTEI